MFLDPQISDHELEFGQNWDFGLIFIHQFLGLSGITDKACNLFWRSFVFAEGNFAPAAKLC